MDDGRSTLGLPSGSTPDAESPAVQIGALEVRERLPQSDVLPATLARWVQEADADIARRRYESALDLTLVAESLAPAHLPLFVRHAELLVATGRPRDAVRMAATIGRLAEARGDSTLTFDLLRIMAHAEPASSRLIDLARAAIGTRQAPLIARYVPAAVGLLVEQGASDAALDLAASWHAGAPDQPEAAFAHVRELLRNGDIDAALHAATPVRDHPVALVAALAAEAATGQPDQWVTVARLARLIRATPSSLAEVQRHLTQMSRYVPDEAPLPIHQALVSLAGGDPRAALQDLAQLTPADPETRYAAALCVARAAQALGDQTSAVRGLRQAFAALEEPAAAELVARAALFENPTDFLSVGRELADALLRAEDAAGAVDVYRRLFDSAPGNAEIARAYAEALGRAGARDEAIDRLTGLLEQQEHAHQRIAALETLQTMVRIAPGNTGYRGRLVEAYLQSGRVGEAVGELFILAQLLERQGRIPDAVAQLQRAAEIAVLSGEWSKVDRIYRYMVRLQPDDLAARHAAATTYLQYGQIEQALEQLREVARISLAQDDPDEAIAALHQIIALAPDDPEPYHRLGEVLSSIGEYGQAERVYRRLAALLPDDPAVRAKQTALAALAQGHA